MNLEDFINTLKQLKGDTADFEIKALGNFILN